MKKPLFWSNIVSVVITGLVVGSVAFGWNSPSAAPTSANGAISVDGAGNVGIGIAAPTQALDVNGYVKGRSGLCINADCRNVWPSGGGGITSISAGFGVTLSPNPITTTGSVAVNTAAVQQRVSGTCAAGSSIRIVNVDGSVTCEVDDTSAGGGVTGSGTAGNVAVWTGATSIGNPTGAVTFPGDLTVNNNSWGTASGNMNGGAGNSSFSLWGATGNWTISCPSGYYMISIGQTVIGGANATPFANCAKL